MKAILDANVLISALLGWDSRLSVEVAVVREAIHGSYLLVLPPELVKELRSTVANRVHLRRAITPGTVDAFVGLLLEAGFVPRELATAPPPICRDPRDDYLLAQAMAEGIDVLVSGDKDLLALSGPAVSFAILSPRAFLARLDPAHPSLG